MNLQVKEGPARPKCNRRFLEFELLANDALDGQLLARCFLDISIIDLLHLALCSGNERPFFMVIAFCIARYKFSFLTNLDTNDHCHGVAACWPLTPSQQEVTINRVLTTFQCSQVALAPDHWCFSFWTDECIAEQNAAR
jgi:hypothetical protein